MICITACPIGLGQLTIRGGHLTCISVTITLTLSFMKPIRMINRFTTICTVATLHVLDILIRHVTSVSNLDLSQYVESDIIF